MTEPPRVIASDVASGYGQTVGAGAAPVTIRLIPNS